MADPTLLYDMAVSLQQSVINCYAQTEYTLPDRHVITEGPIPAHDCLQFSVSLVSNTPTISGTNQLPCANVREANYRIEIVRCTSVPRNDDSPPDPEEMAALARAIYVDAHLLPQCIAELPNCKDITVGPLSILEPSGGFGGVQLAVSWVLGEDVGS